MNRSSDIVGMYSHKHESVSTSVSLLEKYFYFILLLRIIKILLDLEQL